MIMESNTGATAPHKIVAKTIEKVGYRVVQFILTTAFKGAVKSRENQKSKSKQLAHFITAPSFTLTV